MARRPWSHYAAPAAFLLAVTLGVLLVRATLRSEPAGGTTGTTAVVTQPAATTAPTTTATTAPTTPAGAPQSYTVVAGDTFAAISAKTGVPVARIEELNPEVQSTSLVIGQKIRLR